MVIFFILTMVNACLSNEYVNTQWLRFGLVNVFDGLILLGLLVTLLPSRVDYFRTHLRAIHAAIEQGVDLRGYCAWSLMDNLEWSLGFSKRFGIVHVDFETQQRTLKDSAHFYARVIASQGAALDEPT